MTQSKRVAVALGLGAGILALGAAQATLGAADRQLVQAPRFEVDPVWPKPLPNHWILGSVIGVGIDSRDHVFIIHRGDSTLNQRTDVRNHARDTGVWPPSVLAVKEGRQNFPLAKMENKIVMPASFSPVQ